MQRIYTKEAIGRYIDDSFNLANSLFLTNVINDNQFRSLNESLSYALVHQKEEEDMEEISKKINSLRGI